jgi:putative SOS response-associated peptidase YedK
MSERLVIPGRAEAESELSVVHSWWQFSVRFNVAVSHSVPVVRMHQRETEGVMMRWGLVSSSAKGDVTRGGHAHARSDALQSAQDFRSAWFHGRRGIVPLAGFYVWQRTPAGYRRPYCVRVVNRLVFGVAVLWERSVSDDDDVVDSCALVTVPANPLQAELDNTTDQMPAILRREDCATWLGSTVAQAKELLETYPHTRMVTHPVGPYVNDLELDEPRLIQRAPEDPAHGS